MLRHLAAIFIRPAGATLEQQQAACLDYCERHRHMVRALCFRPGDAAALVSAGAATVVVTAYGDGGDIPLEDQIARAGGRLEYVRKPRGRARMEVGTLVAGMYQRGARVDEISHLLDMPDQEVRIALRREGVQIS